MKLPFTSHTKIALGLILAPISIVVFFSIISNAQTTTSAGVTEAPPQISFEAMKKLHTQLMTIIQKKPGCK